MMITLVQIMYEMFVS